MDETLQPDKLTFAFIRDEPAEQDSFGSHNRVAIAIASVIRNNADLKVIGLLGAWGTGKSTVVKLVQSQLKQDTDTKTHLFSYDAWLHQNDPPRRAFLETLIHFLIGEKLTSLDVWQDRLDQLNRQIEESETTSTPTLTHSGRLIAFSLLLWPLAIQFIGHDSFEAAFAQKASAKDFWVFIFGLICLLLPFLIAAAFYFRWRPTKSPLKPIFWTNKNWSTHKAPHQHESILSLVMNKEVQRQRNRVTRSPDPTAIEFQDIFREIMEAVNASKRRFLFVIDNLDRLPEVDAVAMWGTIRSFFLGAQETNRVRKVAQLPTVILPIDEHAVQRMYSASHPEDAPELARSFMDKTFDLTFRVTRPVLSDWNAYLAKQMETVFGPAMPQDWPYITSRFYEKFFAGRSDPNVTPRTINTLINDIAALWLQWREANMSFASVAYYAINHSSIDNDILGAVARPVSGIAELDSDWQRAIAALHYGAMPADAAQILIEQPLRKAIADRDAKSFADLITMPSFDRVVQRIIDQYAVDGIDLTPVLSTAFLVNTLPTQNEIWLLHAWQALRAALRLTGEWRVFGDTEVDAIKSFIKQCPPSELNAFITMLAGKTAALNQAVANNPNSAKPFFAVWSAAFDAAKSNKIALPTIRVPGPADSYLRVAAASRQNVELLKHFSTNVSDGDLVQEISVILTDQARAADAEEKFEALHALGRKLSWNTLIDAAMPIVRDQNASHVGMAAALLCLGCLRNIEKAAKAQTKALVDDGQMLNRLNEAYAASNDTVIARTVALQILANPTFQPPHDGNWDKAFLQRQTLAEMIDAALVEFDNEDNLQSLIDAAAANPMLARIVRAVVDLRIRDERMGRLHIAPIIADLPRYFSCIDKDLQENFLAQFATYETFWDELKKSTLDANLLIILRVLIKLKDDVGVQARAFLSDRLDEVPQDGWNTSVRNNSEPLAIAELLAQAAPTPIHIGSHLYAALDGMLSDILTSTDVSFRTRWYTSARYLTSSARQTLFKAVRDRIHGGAQVSDLPDLLNVGDGDLVTVGGFADEADAAARYIILPLLSDANGRAWLSNHVTAAKAWVNGSEDTTRRFLSERLIDLWRVVDAETRERLELFQRDWSLPELRESDSAEQSRSEDSEPPSR